MWLYGPRICGGKIYLKGKSGDGMVLERFDRALTTQAWLAMKPHGCSVLDLMSLIIIP